MHASAASDSNKYSCRTAYAVSVTVVQTQLLLAPLFSADLCTRASIYPKRGAPSPRHENDTRSHLSLYLNATTMSVRYFFLDDFTGDCISIPLQQEYFTKEGCNVIITKRNSANSEDHINAHSQVLMFWSRRFNEIIEQAQVKRAISPEDPLVATISSRDFTTIRLLIDMIYYGSACVPEHAVPEFLDQAAKMQLKLHEETAVVTPDMKQYTKRQPHGRAARYCEWDSAYASLPADSSDCDEIRDRDQSVRKHRKRKQNDRMSRDSEEGGCKRIRKKSEMENPIQLSPESSRLLLHQGSDLLELSIVPTIDSD